MEISTGSLQLMSSVVRISLGTTRRPSSSMLRIIPVDFIEFPLSAADGPADVFAECYFNIKSLICQGISAYFDNKICKNFSFLWWFDEES